jgi:hypothetical protein
VTPSSGNCVGANFTLIVTVKPTAEIGQLSTVTCSGTPFEVSPTVGFVGNIVPAGTLYTWNAPASTPTFTGVTSGSNAASISGTIRNTTHVQQTITYTVRPLSGDCLGAVFSVVVTVNPTPEFVTLTTVTCSGIEFQVSPAAGFGTNIVPADTRYTWNAPSFTGSVTGGQSSQGIERTHIFGTLSNRTNTQQTVTYQVTPKALSGNCTGAAFTVVVTLNPTPEFVTLTTVTCSGVEFQVSPAVGVGGGNIVPANTLYTWTEPTFTGTVTGGQSSQGIERTSIFGTLSNRTNGQQTVTYQVTPRASSGNCTGAAFSVVVTLNPTPEFVTLSTVSCSGVEFQVSPAAVVGGGNIVPADTRYTWEAPSVTGTVTGGQSRLGVGQTHIFGTLSNRTHVLQTATYIVTPRTLSGNCTGSTFTVVVSVNPTPEFVTLSTVTCSGVEFQVSPAAGVYGGNIVPSNTQYRWDAPSVTGTITGGQSSQGLFINFVSGTLSNRTHVLQTATYSR